MRRAALATVILFLAQAGACAHAGFGAASVFAAAPGMAAGGCAGMAGATTAPDAAQAPARRCERHCAGYARSVPASAPAPRIASPHRLPVARVADAVPPWLAAAPPAPERAPPTAPLRLRLASLQI